MVFNIFYSEPIALGMLIVLFFQPVLVLIIVLAVRGGMTALHVTNGADLNKIAGVLVKILKFNLPLMWTIIFLFGMASTITGFRLLEISIWSDIIIMKDSDSGLSIEALIGKVGEFPMFLFTGWVIGFVIAFALMSVSLAGASAMAASRPPNHHTIWGVASQFVNLLLLAIILVFVPFVLFVIMLGGLGSDLSNVFDLPVVIKYAIAAYVTWSICALSAGTALAYSLTVIKEEKEHKLQMAAMSGMTVKTVDLKALRDSRMKE